MIFSSLPESVEELEKCIEKSLKKSKSENKTKSTSLVLKRMRDYHHPDGTLTGTDEKSDKWSKFNKFVIALVGLWLKLEPKDEVKGEI